MICPRCGRTINSTICNNCNLDFSLETIYVIGADSDGKVRSLGVTDYSLLSYIETIDTYSWKKEGWKKKAEKYETLGRQGNAKAQYEMGKLYMSIWDEVGGEKDCTESMKWYTQAAEQGHIEAQYELGNIFKSGNCGITDFKAATKWYTNAAEQGHVDAMYNLAKLYQKGSEHLDPENKDVKTDKEKAFMWYKRAAEHGNGTAMFKVSLMLCSGEGTEQNLDEAAKWIKLALGDEIEQDSVDTREKLLAVICEEKELMNAIAGIEDSFSKEKLREYKSLRNTYEKIIWLYDNDMLDDHVDTAITTIMGKYKQPYYQHMPAAEEGFAFAQYEIARCYYYGWSGAPEDTKEAVKWYTLAAGQGHVDAQYELGVIYDLSYRDLGLEREKAKQKAFSWYKKAADQGNKSAIEKIAEMYFEGTGTEKNLDEVIRLIRPLAASGDDDAIQLLMAANRENDFERVLERIAGTLNEGQREEYQKIDDLEKKVAWLKENITGADFVIAYEKKRIDEQIESEIADIRSNPELEINRYMSSAEEGDAEDQNRIGELYRFGTGGAPYDIKEAVKWFTYAAEQGYTDAQYSLGEIYDNHYDDLGIEANEAAKKAFAYFKQASEQGNEFAMTSLAKMYYYGNGTERNLSCAIKWAQKGIYDEEELLDNAIKEELMNRIVGRTFSQLTASKIGEYKELESCEDRADWIKENVLEYETIMKDEWEKMQDEFDLEDLNLESLI